MLSRVLAAPALLLLLLASGCATPASKPLPAAGPPSALEAVDDPELCGTGSEPTCYRLHVRLHDGERAALPTAAGHWAFRDGDAAAAWVAEVDGPAQVEPGQTADLTLTYWVAGWERTCKHLEYNATVRLEAAYGNCEE